MTTKTIIREEIEALSNSVVKDIEEVVREAEILEERPVLYYTSPMPGVMYYSLRPTKTER